MLSIGGKGIPDHDSIECYCQFYRRYLIPCQHLFHRDIHGDFIKEEDWAGFRAMFDEYGFDLYISRMKVFEERENDPLAIAVEEQRLEFYAVLE